MTAYTGTLSLSGNGVMGASLFQNQTLYAHPASRDLSGVILEQTVTPNDFVAATNYSFQEFRLPINYPRGEDQKIPNLTGFSTLVTTTAAANLTYTLDVYLDDYGWLTLAQGTATSNKVSETAAYGDAVWFEVYFNSIDVSQIWQKLFRFGVKDAGNITKVWYTTPSPIGDITKALGSDGITPIDGAGTTASLVFKVFAAVADQGTDFLGNTYRSLLVRNESENVATTDSSAKDKYWLSKPNPSQFAIENLYFDLRDDTEPVVVDRLYLDPATPGIWFNVYYSNDTVPGYNEDSWNNLLWTRVPRKFNAIRAEEFAFPEPVRGRFFKVEFTHLQPRYYAPGNFQAPMIYKKHPKWVLDYFLILYEKEISIERYNVDKIKMRYDALDLAFKYYADDIKQLPDSPDATQSSTDVERLVDFFKTQTPPTADQVDLDTLVKINQTMQPFLDHPIQNSRSTQYLLADYVEVPETYSTEIMTYAPSGTARRVTEDQTQLVLEKNFPVTFFYPTCRHIYRTSQSLFENDRAYFAGVKEVAFTRERYTARTDTQLYIESVGDNLNLDVNDFDWENGTWVTNKSDV